MSSSRNLNGDVRRAFTLVELLVVIAIIGVLVGLLLPAVQAARESARRMQCSNHLKQIGLALHNYESSFKRMPSGYVSYATSNGVAPSWAGLDATTWDGAPGWGWAVGLLPYLEQGSLANSLRLDRPIWDASNRPLIETKISTFLCPSMSYEFDAFTLRDETGGALTRYGVPIRVGRTSYVASHGQESCWGDCGSAPTATVFTNIYTGATRTVQVNGNTGAVADGPFYRNSRVKFAEVTDGLTNTIFFGEHSSKLSEKTWVGAIPGAFAHPRFNTPDNEPEDAATLLLVHAGPSGGEVDVAGLPIIHPINFPALHVCQMYSEHAGGGNVTFGDGSVQFVAEVVDLIVWAEISSISEGEVMKYGF